MAGMVLGRPSELLKEDPIMHICECTRNFQKEAKFRTNMNKDCILDHENNAAKNCNN